MSVLKATPDQEQFIVKTELAFLADTNKLDKIQRLELYKKNRITHDEKIENLLMLLSDNQSQVTATIANLPSNADTLKLLKKTGEVYNKVVILTC